MSACASVSDVGWKAANSWAKMLLSLFAISVNGARFSKVHFRNVDQPLPHFVETFVDNGYQDMYQVAKALREVNFQRRADSRPYPINGR